MSFLSLLIDEVTVFNPDDDTSDRYGNVVPEFDAGTTVPARVEQVEYSAEEVLLNRDTRVTRYYCYLMPDVEITALSKVVFEGLEYRVHGDPALLSDRTGPHHFEAILQKVEG